MEWLALLCCSMSYGYHCCLHLELVVLKTALVSALSLLCVDFSKSMIFALPSHLLAVYLKDDIPVRFRRYGSSLSMFFYEDFVDRVFARATVWLFMRCYVPLPVRVYPVTLWRLRRDGNF